MSDHLVRRLHPRWHAEVARMVLETPVYEWIRSGSGGNEAAFDRWRLRPRAMVDVSDVDTSVLVLGERIAMPVLAAPMGLLSAIHPEGEQALAVGMASAGSGTVLAVNSTVAVEEVSRAAPGAPLWFQLYNWDDREATERVVRRAVEAGCRALVPLVNTPVAAAHVPAQVGFRLPPGVGFAHFTHSPGLDPSLDQKHLRWLAELSPIPLIAKGVMHPDDALRALDAGCAGVIISNHGNRQLPRSIGTLDALPVIARAVGDDGEVYLDGGVRNGTDVLVALALGARAVMVGRPLAYALAVGGADAVRRAVETMRAELLESAALCGVTTMAAIPESLVVSSFPEGQS